MICAWKGAATNSPLRGPRIVSGVLCGALVSISVALAQVPTPPITSSGLNTQITAPTTLPGGQINYNITGGTRPGGGTNLFHSFGNFNVPTNNIANFLNDSGAVTSNILARVTGGSTSNIFGTIQTTGFGNANLFLMNPAGFLFGSTATVNVGGMVAFTTADYLKLADGVRFNAIPDGAADALLSSAPVAAFGFLGSNPGAITVQGSQLAVNSGQGLELVGGNITVQSKALPDGTSQAAQLSAPGGHIHLASVASPGEIVAGTLDYAPNVKGQSFTSFGSIQISEKSVIDASGDGGGTVLIRGGRFVIDDSRISANVTGPTTGPFVGTPGQGVDIQVSQDAVIQNGAVIESNVTGDFPSAIDSGGVRITADRIQITGFPGSLEEFGAQPFTGIKSDTQGAGHSGNIVLRAAGNIEFVQVVNVATDSGFSSDGSMGSPTRASGNAGNVELTSTHGNILITQGGGATILSSQAFNSSGNTGKVIVSAPQGDITLDGAEVFTIMLGSGKGGAVEITAKNLQMNGSFVTNDNQGPLKPGGITITLDGNLTVGGNSVIATTSESPTGASADLSLTARNIVLTQGSLITSATFASGPGGHLTILADTLQITAGTHVTSGSTFAPSFPGLPRGVIPSGAGGDITIRGLTGPAASVMISGADSGVFSNAEGTGPGGNINVTAQSVTVQNGGTMSASTSGTEASATGGSIAISAGQSVTLNAGASITANSTGPANAGNIFINAGQNFTAVNSSVRTDAAQASGGNITVNTSDMVHLTNSQINASVQGAQTTVGGNVTIDPSFVILQSSQILAQATQGQGGNISITTNSLLSDSGSLISASSQSGVNGTVNVQSPISQAGGKIIPLSKTTLEFAPLLSQRCAALASGQYSSFVVAGRDALPVEPGSWLASPLIELPTVTSVETGMNRLLVLNTSPDTPESAIVSVRRISRTGAAARLLETDWWIGCES